MPGRSRLLAASVVGVLIALGSAVAFAQSPAAEMPKAAPGVVYGVVTDDNGAPIAGAMVSAVGGITVFAISDDHGRFEITTPGRAPISSALTERDLSPRAAGRSTSALAAASRRRSRCARPSLKSSPLALG